MNLKKGSRSRGQEQYESISKQLQTPESNEMLLNQWYDAAGEYKTSNAELDKAWDGIQESINPPVKVLGFTLIKIAAIFITGLMFGLGTLLIVQNISSNDNYITIKNPKGTRSEINLADGSKVWLNSNSVLTYPKEFKGDMRSLELQGEAYFEVEHNPLKPFVVKSNNISVTALGTEFYVSSYTPEGSIYTGLIDGKIKIDAFDQEVILDEPAALRVSNLSNKIFFQKNPNPAFYSWKEGKMMFDNTNLMDFAERLEHWYNIEVNVHREIMSKYTFTITVRDEPVDEIFELLKEILPIEYKKTTMNNYELFER